MRQLKITKKPTDRNDEQLQRYLKEISKIPINSDEVDIELGKRIKGIVDNFKMPHESFFGEKIGENIAEPTLGEKIKALIAQDNETSRLFIALRNKLARGHLRFVVTVAKQYQHNGLTLSELINEGNQGLLKAASRYDPTRGFKFISYAVTRIRQSILEELSKNGRLIRIPVGKIEDLNNAGKIADLFAQEHEREPNIEELQELVKLDKDILPRIMFDEVASLDAPFPGRDGEDTNCLGDRVQATDRPNFIGFENETRRETKAIILTALQNSGLSERQMNVLISYYGINIASEEILYGTKDWVCKKYEINYTKMLQIKDTAIEKLQKNEFVLNILTGNEQKGRKVEKKGMTIPNSNAVISQTNLVISTPIVDALSSHIKQFLDTYMNTRTKQISASLGEKNKKYHNIVLEVLQVLKNSNANIDINKVISKANAHEANRVSKNDNSAIRQTRMVLELVLRKSKII